MPPAPSDPEKYSIDEMMERLKGQSSENPAAGELVTRPDGHTVTSAQEVKPGSRLRLRFADGEVSTRAEGRPGEIRQGELGL